MLRDWLIGCSTSWLARESRLDLWDGMGWTNCGRAKASSGAGDWERGGSLWAGAHLWNCGVSRYEFSLPFAFVDIYGLTGPANADLLRPRGKLELIFL